MSGEGNEPVKCYRPTSLLDLIREDELRLLLTGIAAEMQMPARLVVPGGERLISLEPTQDRLAGSEFCRQFSQETAVTHVCTECDREMAVALLNGASTDGEIQLCPLGLTRIVAPIRAGGGTTGVLITGPIRQQELDREFENNLKSEMPKYGRAGVRRLQAAYRSLDSFDNQAVQRKQQTVQEMATLIQSIAVRAFKLRRNQAENRFMVQLGQALGKLGRKERPLNEALAVVGRHLSEFFGINDYCLAIYGEPRNGARRAFAIRNWGSGEPVDTFPFSVLSNSEDGMCSHVTNPSLAKELFPESECGSGFVAGGFNHSRNSYALIHASRGLSDQLGANPQMHSRHFWKNVIEVFQTSFAEIRYIHELRLSEQKLEAEGLQVRRYIEKVGHDLKHPLSGILLYVEQAKETMDGHTLRKSLSRIDEFGAKLVESIDVLLSSVNPSAFGAIAHDHRESVRLKEMVCAIVAQHRHHIQKRRNLKRIEFAVHADPTFLGNRRDLARIFENLVDNAVKYCYPGKTVFAELSDDERHIHFEIENYGLGILPDEQQQVWEKYYRGKHDDAWSESVDGSGLGLYIVAQTVKAYGGEVWFDSAPSAGEYHDANERASGRGYVTKFHVTLPLDRGQHAT